MNRHEERKWIKEIDKLKAPKGICKKGCSFCCYQIVDVFSFELSRIVKYIEDNDIKPDNKEINKVLDLFVAEKMDHETFRSLKIKCAFLKNDVCQIYPVRPIACKLHMQFDSVNKCKINHLRNEPHSIRTDLLKDIFNKYPELDFILLNCLPEIFVFRVGHKGWGMADMRNKEISI